MQPHVVPMESMKFSFDKEIEPTLHIQSGEEVVFFTEDANVSLITEESHIWDDFQKLYAAGNGCNPVSGPVYIDGARKGDYLAVEILSVKAGEERNGGYTALYPGLGALSTPASLQDNLEARTKICRIDGNSGLFKTNDGSAVIRFDLNQFIGTIGVAPKEDRRSSYFHGQDYCGNIDCPDVCEGTTVVLPCNVDGGLLSIGDVHGAQGDGEITGCALECRGEVRVRVTVLRGEEAKYCAWPQVNSESYIGTIICGGGWSLTEQIKQGYVELVHRMEKYYGFDKLDAYQLLNLVGKVRIGQVGHDMNSCVVKIDRRYLTGEKEGSMLLYGNIPQICKEVLR